VVSSTHRPHFTPEKDPIPILQESGWAPGPVWTGRKSRPHQDSIPDRPARSQSLYRLIYHAHKNCTYVQQNILKNKGAHSRTGAGGGGSSTAAGPPFNRNLKDTRTHAHTHRFCKHDGIIFFSWYHFYMLMLCPCALLMLLQ